VLRDEEGSVVTVLSLIQDITLRKSAEDKLYQSYEQICALTEHLQNIREEERTHIAREIHDELGQQLTVLNMEVDWLSRKINDQREAIQNKLQEVSGLLDSMVGSVRRISSELRPGILDHFGLAAAIQWQLGEYKKRWDIQTHFIEPEEELEVSLKTKTQLYRILQEALTNVARHADATEITVELAKKGDLVNLTITDNGAGFDQQKESSKKTLGIIGMKERATLMGGDYKITSEPGKGTKMFFALPFTLKE
jgi:signal transduction histidine kinase